MSLRHILAAVAVLAAGTPAARADEAVAYAEADSMPEWDFNLDEVVVTGTRVPKLLKDSPVQTRLITAKDIARTDATNIEDLLQQEMPGIEFSYAMNQQVHLNFNGFGGQSVMFLVNGERLAGETMDDVDFSRLDMNNIERIEIVKGASSALYGSNAGGGVINIITRDATRPWNVSAGVRLARHNEQRYRLLVANHAKYLSNVLSASHGSLDNYDVKNGPDPIARVVSTIYGNKTWNIQDQLSITPAEGLKLSARAGYFFRELTRVEDSPERYRDYSGGLRGEWAITPTDRLELSYSFDQYDKSNMFRLIDRDVRVYSNVQNAVRGLYNHSFAEGNILTLGADYMRDYLLNTKLEDPRHHQDVADVFAQYDWTVDDKWELVGALRYDYFSDSNDSRVTPKLTARYKPRRNINLRASYGMGFRAPTLKERYYDFDMAGIWIVRGNKDLKPESSHNITLSGDMSYGRFNYTLSLYFNDIHDRISTGLPYYLPGDNKQLYLNYINLDRYTVPGGSIRPPWWAWTPLP